MASGTQITLKDKLVIIPNLTRAIASALLRLISRPFSGGAKANTLLKDILFAGLRTHLSIINPATEQWLNPSTESNYLEFAKKHGFQPDTDVLDSGLKLLWLGPKKAEKVILYCHGGGYSLSASPGHLAWLFDLQNDLSKTLNISIVLIGYTLAPQGQYPLQLKQERLRLETATMLISRIYPRHCQRTLNLYADLLSPKFLGGRVFGVIILAGDSAGGNMAFSLISHLLHPHPEIGSRISLSEPLAGVLLISPWVKFATDDDSVKRNAKSDMVTPQAADRWSSLFLGSSPLDNYNQPILADLSWFSGLELLVKDILVWGGGQEVLIDSIEAIAKKLEEAHARTELVVQPNAAHEDFIIDRLLGYKKSEGTVAIERWIVNRAYS